MVWWWNSTFETPYDVVLKTAKVELSCHMNIDLQAGIYGTDKLEKKCEKKPHLILFDCITHERANLSGLPVSPQKLRRIQ